MEKSYVVEPKRLGKIAPEIYSVFAEHLGGVIYDGIYCGEDSSAENIHGFRKFIIDKMREARIPLIRWPGGCFAETYDWRDGIGPRSERPVRINWWNQCDGRYEPNQIGTDEFIDFCRLCGAEPYIAANMTSTTPLDIRDWIDYCNSPAGTTTYAALREKNGHKEPYNVKLWGVGNENWGGGGNMTPEYYANEYRRYAEVMNNASAGLELVSCGPNGADYSWTQTLMDSLSTKRGPMAGMAVHYYCGSAGDTINFTDDEWDQLIRQAAKMREIIDRHWSTVVSYGMENQAKLCIDEWGCWHPGGTGPSKGANLFEQQVTMRDAVVSALTLNIFNQNCDKIKLCATAQLVNNLHTLFLAHDADCICTPNYHVFNMYKGHQGGDGLEAFSSDSDVTVSASEKDGALTLTAANLSCRRDIELDLNVYGKDYNSADIVSLANDDLRAHNTFDAPEAVIPTSAHIDNFDGRIELARGSVVAITLR